jgi:GLPGLI family protein
MKKILLLLLLSLTELIHGQSLTGTLVQKHLKGLKGEMLYERELTPVVFSYVYSENKSIQKLISEDISSVQYKLEEHSSRIVLMEDEFIMPYYSVYYKDFKENIYKINSKTKNSELAIKDKITQYNWTIIDETKIINGYKCLKAITNGTRFTFKQPITAWYTKEIQINDGPLDYTGLPGFVMQVEIGNLTLFTFEKLNLINENTQIIEPQPSVKEITFEEYNNSTSR